MRWPSVEAQGGADALNRLETVPGLEAVVLDHWLPDLDVDDLELSLRAHHPSLDVLLVNMGADDICRSNRVLAHARSRELTWQLCRAEMAFRTAQRPDSVLPEEEGPAPRPAHQMPSPVISIDEEWIPLPGVLGTHPSMCDLSRLVRLVAPRKTSVLITGETGTGKELIARAVHHLSPRSEMPFVAVNCAAIPDNLLEAELFGYTRGAFTGAVQPKEGRIQAAHGGTLFLDEIGELPASLQAKLLRFLQEHEVQRLGSNDLVKVDVRVVAATHVSLARPANDRTFRSDLYYRLAVFPVELPSLRDRGDDMLLLAREMLTRLCTQDGAAAKRLSQEVCERLASFDWPGNVRELQHVIERAYILSQDESVITLRHLPTLNSQSILNAV